MPILGKAHSALVAERFSALGWTLRTEFRASADGQPAEYLFEWLGAGSARSPYAKDPREYAFALTGLELQILCSSLFFATGGAPAPDEVHRLVGAHRTRFENLAANLNRQRDAAWLEAGAASVETRAQLIQVRSKIQTSIAISLADVLPIAALLGESRRDWETNGLLGIVSGLKEYASDSLMFGELRSRLLAWYPRADGSG